MKQKTIVALATAPGVAGISVIRISGELAFEICDKVFVGKRKIVDASSHTILYGKIVSEDVILDSVTISVFKAPHSYTGENVIELGTHGGYIVANQIIELLLKKGASPAEPGEFTKRAFLNGKMDLTQVEAVADLIHSVSVPGAQTSARQLDGKFTLKLKSIREELIRVAGLLELELDFSEEDIELIPKSHIKEQIDKVVYALSQLLADYKSSQILRTGYNIALTGKPNAGKSTLFNFLVKKNRAIVSDIAGTTRDYIEEMIHLNGLAFRITDTAGLRETSDIIEIEGIKMVEEVLQKANLILLLHSIDEQSSYLSLKEKFESLYPQAKIIVVFTKADLQDKAYSANEDNIYISAKRADDIKLLLDKFYILASQSIDNMRDALINDRQKALIEQAIDYLQTSISSLEEGMTNEVVAYDIRNSSKALGEITGDSWNEEVLAAIFSQFCIGK